MKILRAVIRDSGFVIRLRAVIRDSGFVIREKPARVYRLAQTHCMVSTQRTISRCTALANHKSRITNHGS